MVLFERVADGVKLVRGRGSEDWFTGIYVIVGSKVAVVDTGYRHHPEEALTPALRRLGFALRDVDLILATHGHADHIGGVRWTVDGSGAEVLAHPADRWLFAGPEVHRRPGVVHDLIGLLTSLQETERALEWDAMLLKNVGSSVIVDRSLDDGDVIDLGAGLTITVIHTPGHTAGSVTYVINPGGVALTGDAIQGRGYRLGLPLYEDPGAYGRSLGHIRDARVSILAMGHGFRHSAAGSRPTPIVRGAGVHAILDDSAAFPPIAADVARRVLADHPLTLADGIEAFLELMPEPYQVPQRTIATAGLNALLCASLHLRLAGFAPALSR